MHKEIIRNIVPQAVKIFVQLTKLKLTLVVLPCAQIYYALAAFQRRNVGCTERGVVVSMQA